MGLFFIYAGILMGIVLEGEMIMLSSVIAAHRGFLNLWVVMGIGFSGTLGSDWFYFYPGRKKGKIWLLNKQKLKRKSEKVTQRLQKLPCQCHIESSLFVWLKNLCSCHHWGQ